MMVSWLLRVFMLGSVVEYLAPPFSLVQSFSGLVVTLTHELHLRIADKLYLLLPAMLWLGMRGVAFLEDVYGQIFREE